MKTRFLFLIAALATTLGRGDVPATEPTLAHSNGDIAMRLHRAEGDAERLYPFPIDIEVRNGTSEVLEIDGNAITEVDFHHVPPPSGLKIMLHAMRQSETLTSEMKTRPPILPPVRIKPQESSVLTVYLDTSILPLGNNRITATLERDGKRVADAEGIVVNCVVAVPRERPVLPPINQILARQAAIGFAPPSTQASWRDLPMGPPAPTTKP